MTIICGLDPGLSGALAFVGTDGSCITFDMPTLQLKRGGKNKREIDAHALAALFWKQHAGHVFIEDIWNRPGIGSTGALMKAFGIAIGVVAAVGVPMTTVAPRTWKKALGVPAAKDGARARASQLLPAHAEQWRLVKHDGRAEAALLGLYGLRSFNAIAEAAE